MNRLYTKGSVKEATSKRMVSLCFASSNTRVEDQSVGSRNMTHWFPMRITYHREMRIKALLDDMGVESFLPMHWEMVETKNGGKKRSLQPAIHNLIFVKSTQEFLTELKMTRTEFAPMRYIMKRSLSKNDKNEIMHVPDQQMENFMRVASVQDDRVMFLDSNDFINRIGQRVKVIEGYFSGVEGVIKRINKNKRIVVQLEGVAAVAIAFVPASYVRQIVD
jgi:transcription antitermination factor NusG